MVLTVRRHIHVEPDEVRDVSRGADVSKRGQGIAPIRDCAADSLNRTQIASGLTHRVEVELEVARVPT